MEYCPDIFKNLYIEKRNENKVNLAFCCIAKISPEVDTVDQNVNFLQEQRNFLLTTGKLPDSCHFCKDFEDRKVLSRRLELLKTDNIFDPEIKLKKLQYNCDNFCNLKCIICSSKYSSSWIEDEKILKNYIELHGDLNKKLKRTKNNKLSYNLDYTQLDEIYFNGGEPFMSNDHINFLNNVVDNSDTSKITLLYNTNATFPIKDSFLRIWEKFKNVTLMCSIDGIEEVFEYVRFPAKWTVVNNNLQDYKKIIESFPRINVELSPAIGIHNVFYTDILLDWANANNFKVIPPLMVFGKLSLVNFPIEHSDSLLDYVNSLPNYNGKDILINEVKSISNPNLDWIEYLNRLDAIRGNSWKTSLSKLYNLINS